MKLWLPSGPLFDYSNPNRALSRYTLHIRHRNRLLICWPHLPGCKLWLTNPQPSRQRCLLLFHLHLYAHRAGPVLRLLPLQRNLNNWCCTPPPCNNNCLCRVRSTLGTNVILRRHRYHQSPLCSTLCWQRPSTMNLRGLLRRQRYTYPIFCLPLPFPLRHCRCNPHPPSVPTRDRLQQPPWFKLRRRQNLFPPLLLIQGPPRLCSTTHCPHSPGPVFPQPLRRP